MYFIKKSSYNTTLLFKKDYNSNRPFSSASKYWFIDDFDNFDCLTDPYGIYPLTLELLLKYLEFKEKICKVKLEDFKPNRKKLIKDIILWLTHQK